MTEIQKLDKTWCLALIACLDIEQIYSITKDILKEIQTDIPVERDTQWRFIIRVRLNVRQADEVLQMVKELARRIAIPGSREAIAIGLAKEATK